MFVQVIQGKVSDEAAFNERLDTWEREIKPGAIGFLGSTGGVADDGTFIMAARFDSAEAAQRNGDRDEQTGWWNETSKFLEDVTFYDCTDVDTLLEGGSDDAGFVQVIQGYANDKEKVRAMGKELEPRMKEARPDVIGGLVAWGPDDGFSQLVYFRSEAEARQHEQQSQGPADDDPTWGGLLRDLKYIDLRNPRFTSA